MPGHERFLRVVAVIAIVGGPLGYVVGGGLAPAVHLGAGATIAANAAASPVANNVHLVAFLAASYLLPIGVVGLAYLAYHRAPRLAAIAGVLGVLGWAPFSALTALDDLAAAMARLPHGGSYATLLHRFTDDPVMVNFLVVYVLGHLLAYVLLGVALRRAGALPTWAATAMIASSPLTVVAFVLPGEVGAAGATIGVVALSLLVVSSVPAARAMLPAAVGAMRS